MGRSRALHVDSSRSDNVLEYTVACKLSVWEDLKEIKALSEAGHNIVWSGNERWCVINGKTFNISKSVYIKRVIETELEDEFTDYTWDEDTRLSHIKYVCDMYEYGGEEVLFDARVHDSSTFDFDKILSHLK